MEVEFDVKITPNILYDYMLQHTYSRLPGLMGTLVGALMLVLFASNRQPLVLIIALVILLYLPWTLFVKSRRQILTNPSFQEPLRYTLDEEGLTVSQGEAQERMDWENMHKAVSTGRSIILYTSPVNATIFPKRQLGEERTAVVEMISTHMPPKKVKIRS